MAYPTSETAGAAVPKFSLVKLSSGKAIVCAATTDRPYACTQDYSAAADGDDLTVEHPSDRVKLTAGAAIAKGAQIMPTTGGKVITYVAGAGVIVCGYAVEAAAADGDVIECVFDVSELPDPTT